MDASDTLAKRKAAAIFNQKKAQLAAAQPAADCNKSNCGQYASCKLNFKSYEEKLLYTKGRNGCVVCNCGK